MSLVCASCCTCRSSRWLVLITEKCERRGSLQSARTRMTALFSCLYSIVLSVTAMANDNRSIRFYYRVVKKKKDNGKSKTKPLLPKVTPGPLIINFLYVFCEHR